MSTPLTNSRKCKCLDCAVSIPTGKGHAVAIGQYICGGCQKVRAAQSDARRYAKLILNQINNPEDWWLVSAMLASLTLRAGEKAPLVLQAASDRTAWADQVTYSLACDICRQEARALGLDVQVA